MISRRVFINKAVIHAILTAMLFAGESGCSKEKQVEAKCAECPMRARYEANPKSLISRIWKWHIRWCPGWKNYLISLPESERQKIMETYR
jgi:hypothetical protein